MLEAIRADPSMGEDVLGGTDYLRVELHMAASTEMITRLEDFMRRRSKIEQVVRNVDIDDSEGLLEVAQILFGDLAQEKLTEYLSNRDGAAT
jgi:glycerol-3-phosphate dehydrogenase